MRSFITLIFLSIFSNTLLGQRFHQFTITTENDSYISVNNDGYYTNGAKIAYQWGHLTPDKKKIYRINSLYGGQNIYTAKFSGEIRKERLDRPLTGYLYAGYQNTLYNNREDMVRWGLNVGAIGANSYGEQMQKAAHNFMQIYKPTFWDLQLQSAYGVNIDFAWSPQINPKNEKSKWFIKPMLSATGGTFFNSAGMGGALIYGKLNKNSSSAFWNNHRGKTKEDKEFYAFLFPMFYLKAYDATVQGGMFNTTPEKIPGKLNPFFLQTKLGVNYVTNRLSFGFTAIYESKQSLTQFYPQLYGSIQVGMMW